MEINFPTSAPSAPTRVWDTYVPLIASKNVTHAYISDAIEEPSFYNELCFALTTATSSETFHLHINTPGGMLDSAFMIIDSIKNSEARVIGHLTGTVASAGTIIALACDDIVISNHLAWMSHNYSAIIGGKGHEMKARQEFTDKTLSSSFTEIHEGFFSTKEIQQLIDGKDFWLTSDEVATRWARRTTPISVPRIGDVIDEVVTPAIKRGRPRKAN